jgi:putative peptidoglycan lipid II flippase
MGASGDSSAERLRGSAGEPTTEEQRSSGTVDDASPEEEPTTGGSSGQDTSSGRSSALVGTGILLSRITGLVRERAVGHFFGTGFAADAFTAAFRIPNLLQNLLGEGVLSASFIPVYSKLLAEGREEEAGRVAGAIAGLLTAVAGGLAVAGVLLARPLTAIVAAGLPDRTFELTVVLMRVIFPGIGFLVLSAWCLGVLNSHRRFFLSYVAPVIWNVAQIAILVGVGLTVYAGEFGAGGADPDAQQGLVLWLAWGTVLGGLLQFAVQVPPVLRSDANLRLSLRTDLPGVRRTVRAFLPIVAGRGVVQLSTFVDIFLASFLAVGALAALRYGQMLYLLPISLFGMSVAAAELPELSAADHDDRQALKRRLDAGMARIAFFVVPTTVGFIVVGDLIIGTLFQTGEFDQLVTVQVWVVLAAYSFGLLASTAARLLQSALYGIGDPRTPAKVAAIRVGVSLVLGVLLMFQLDRFVVVPGGIELIESLPAFGPLEEGLRDAADDQRLEHLGASGLALAAAIGSWVEYWLLRRKVTSDIGPTSIGGGRLRRLTVPVVVTLLATLVARFVLGGLHPLLGGTLAVAFAGMAYLAAARAVGLQEVQDVGRLVRRLTGR